MALDLVPLLRKKKIQSGDLFRLRFRVMDDAEAPPMMKAGPPTPDALTPDAGVRVLIFLAAGTWQLREWAEPIGNGIYEVAYEVPQAGVYYVFFECPSMNMGFDQFPHLVLQATGTDVTTFKRTLPATAEAIQ